MKCSVQCNRAFSPRVPASKYFFAIPFFSLLSVLTLVSFFLAPSALLRAQSHKGAFDSACYRPQLGVSGEIDTICGSIGGQEIGALIKNVGTKPNGEFGNIFIENLDPVTHSMSPASLFQVGTGSTFNLHQLQTTLQKFPPKETANEPFILGHFRDRSHLDVFVPYNWKIYWADNQGNYDTTNHTVVQFRKHGDNTGNLGLTGGFIPPYITHLTSDTVDDIVMSFMPDYNDMTRDTIYLALFRGAVTLGPKDTIFEDTSCVLFANFGYTNVNRGSIQGDFRGVGRDDLIISGQTESLPGSREGDFFYFRNDPPFSLDKLAQAITQDTLMAAWQNQTIISSGSEGYFYNLVMSALPKSSGDKSLDWLQVFPTKAHPDNVIYFFRGGPDFGSHRLTIDSAAFQIPPPGIGDTWANGLINCGDMTGTGNRVMLTVAGGGGYWEPLFYVTGEALDTYIDMVIQPDQRGAAGGVDTLTANADSLEDLLYGASGYFAPRDFVPPDGSNDTSESGSVWLIYGSKQIPVRLNPQWADVRTILQSSDNTTLTFAPDPAPGWSVATIVWPEAEEADYEVQNTLGMVVQSGSLRMLGGAEKQRIYFSNLTSGVYYVTIHGAYVEARAKIAIVR
jgi:hypothetical protein